MRIRKRPLAATSSGEPELTQSSNGGLHVHAGSNPSFQDPKSFLLSPGSIIKQEQLLLAGSGYSATHRLSQKQLPAEAVTFEYIAVSSGVESREDGKGLIMREGGGNPKAKTVMDVQHHEVKHMHLLDGDDNVKDMDMKGCRELGLLKTRGERDKSAEACRKARHSFACKGSALHEEIKVLADPAMVDASDYPRKVRPLQLILCSDYSPTAPKLPTPLCPTSISSKTLSCTNPLRPRKFVKTSPCVPTETLLLPSPAAGSVIKQQQIADEKSLDAMSDEGEIASRCSDQSVANPGDDQAELESCGLLQDCRPVSSWQGHRRPRSYVRGGRGFNGAPAAVNPLLKTENQLTEQKRKKPNQTKTDILVSPCISLQAPTAASPAFAADNCELRMQDCCAAPKNKAHTKKTKNETLVLPSLSAPYDFQMSTKTIGSLAAARSLKAKRATPSAIHTYDDHVASVAPGTAGAAASDHGWELESMRCRRNDGRGWRCKEQVVKVGAPFCHYHTLKMREKHAASVARKLLRQLQGEMKISLRYADVSSSLKERRKIIRSSQSVIAVHRDAEEEENDEQQKMHANVEKQQLRRRWRKKCKPCIRRLHDIHDRARPAATDGLDFVNPCAQDTYTDSPLVRSRSPLPECLLNTDPYEWRSDVP